MLEHLTGKVLANVAVQDGAFADFAHKYLEMRQTKDIRGKIKGVRELASRFGNRFQISKGSKTLA